MDLQDATLDNGRFTGQDHVQRWRQELSVWNRMFGTSTPSFSTEEAKLAYQAAIERVDEIKELSLDELDLSNGLDELEQIPDSIRRLKSVKDLRLNNTRISDLEPIKGLKGLKRLWISNTRVASLAPLAGLKGLTTLIADNTSISSLQPLSELPNLTVLYIGDTNVTDLGPLAGLSNLTELNLPSTRVTSLEPLLTLKKLEYLDVSGTTVGSLRRLVSGYVGQDYIHIQLQNSVAAQTNEALAEIAEIDNDRRRFGQLRAYYEGGVPESVGRTIEDVRRSIRLSSKTLDQIELSAELRRQAQQEISDARSRARNAIDIADAERVAKLCYSDDPVQCLAASLEFNINWGCCQRSFSNPGRLYTLGKGFFCTHCDWPMNNFGERYFTEWFDNPEQAAAGGVRHPPSLEENGRDGGFEAVEFALYGLDVLATRDVARIVALLERSDHVSLQIFLLLYKGLIDDNHLSLDELIILVEDAKPRFARFSAYQELVYQLD